MKNYYYLVFLLLFSTLGFAQKPIENIYVDKAWVCESEDDWSTFEYEGKIVFTTMPVEGNLQITNYDFLYDFCRGKAKFSDKSTYTKATFENTRKLSAKVDKQGILCSVYEGVLSFQSGTDYYSTLVVITILEKGYLVGIKMQEKNNNKLYAFSFKPNS